MGKNKRNKRTYNKGEMVKQILLFVGGLAAVSALTFVLAAAPGFGMVAKKFLDWYESQDKGRRQRIRKTFFQLRRNRLVEEKEINGKQVLMLSEDGKRRVLEYRIDDMKFNFSKRWDGKWRLVIFDVPERFKKAREVLREKLKEWKFYALQKSVFVTPYPCNDEIDFITEFYRISPFVRIVEAAKFDGAEDVKEFFCLKS